MYTTVKMPMATKRRLDLLRARVARILGAGMTQAQIIDEMARILGKDPAAFASRIRKDKRTFGPKEFQELKKHRIDFGVKTSEEDVDLHLYGWDKRERPSRH